METTTCHTIEDYTMLKEYTQAEIDACTRKAVIKELINARLQLSKETRLLKELTLKVSNFDPDKIETPLNDVIVTQCDACSERVGNWAEVVSTCEKYLK